MRYETLFTFKLGNSTYQASKRNISTNCLPYSVHLVIGDTLHNGHYFGTIQQLADHVAKSKELAERLRS